MSSEEEKKTDRRSILAAAAAAGTAVPFIGGVAKAAMAETVTGTKANIRFVVDLGDVSLPDAVAEKLGQDIRQLALRAVAATGIKFEEVPPAARGVEPGRLLGLWIHKILKL